MTDRDTPDSPASERDESSEPSQPPKSARATRSKAKPRTTKGRKRRRPAGEDEELPLLDAQGRERPQFLRSFPDDPELNQLSAAFEAGNYAYVRQEAPKLAKATKNRAVEKAARELMERIQPDPLAKYLLLISVLLLLFLVIHSYTSHGH